MASVRAALREGEERLAGGESPRLDAEILLAHALDKPRAWLYAWPEADPPTTALTLYRSLLEQRAAGQPMAYLCGRREFWSLPLRVSPAVLIPRHETELLVELALDLLPDSSCEVADLGTGSGAIALALASERPAWRLIASDASPGALELARVNAGALGLANVEFHLGDWCEALPAEALDAVLSNPPYIEEGDPHLEEGDVRFEPRDALVSADKGLADIRRIAAQAVGRLRPGGWLLLEHGYTQGGAVRDILAGQGYADIATHKDLGGQERVTLGKRT